ncbi:MAG: hypothetical protein ACYDDF_06930 [Thermoplasmatota archaeon]
MTRWGFVGVGLLVASLAIAPWVAADPTGPSVVAVLGTGFVETSVQVLPAIDCFQGSFAGALVNDAAGQWVLDFSPGLSGCSLPQHCVGTFSSGVVMGVCEGPALAIPFELCDISSGPSGITHFHFTAQGGPAQAPSYGEIDFNEYTDGAPSFNATAHCG